MLLRTSTLLLFATGCQLLIADESAKDTRSGFHDVTLTWKLKNLDGSVMSSCPPGFTTLVAHLYVEGYVEPPDALVKIPCTPEGSLTQKTATGGRMPDPDPENSMGSFSYEPTKDIWIDITEETQREFAAQSYVYFVEKLDSDTTINFDLYPAGGVGVAVWELQSKLTSAFIPSCASAGVDEIEAAVRRLDAGENAPFVVVGKWPCGNVDPYFYYSPDGQGTTLDGEFRLGSGHTTALSPGYYVTELRAKRAGAIVGTGAGYFETQTGNSYHQINGDPITINDR